MKTKTLFLVLLSVAALASCRKCDIEASASEAPVPDIAVSGATAAGRQDVNF